MKKLLFLAALAISPLVNQAEYKQSSTMVYVCTGPTAKRYHKYSNCKGLSNCSGSIAKVSLEKAKSMGKTPCRMCY